MTPRVKHLEEQRDGKLQHQRRVSSLICTHMYLLLNHSQVPMPDPKEQTLGGHAVVMVGYDSNHRLWIMRNSWGTSWGDKV